MMRILGVVVVLAGLVTTAAAGRSGGWITLSETDESSYEIRVLVSADGSQVALDTSGYSVINGNQEAASVCAANRTDRDACDHFFMLIPEGGSTPGDDDRFAKTLVDGGFTPVKLRRTRDRSGKIGKLRLRLERGVLTVRRGKRAIARVELEGDDPRLDAAGLTRGGDLAVVVDGHRVVLIDLP